jgi:phage terminase small subunit
MSKKGKAGTSKAAAAQRRALFVEAFCENGGNATKAAITAGYSRKTARAQGSRLLTGVDVAKAIAERRAAMLVKAQAKTDLTAEEVLRSLARDIRFDPAKLYNEDGSMKAIHELDEDTRLALRGVETLEEFAGRGDDRELTGYTKKVKFPEKTAAREQGMKHFGLYEEDNKQQPPTLLAPGVRTVKLEPFKGRRAQAPR